MQSNYYEGKAALIKISEYYTKMELFGSDGLTCDSAVFVFSCRLLKTELFENDDVTVSKTPRVDGENYQKRKKLLRFQTKTDTSGRTKRTQKLYVWKDNF